MSWYRFFVESDDGKQETFRWYDEEDDLDIKNHAEAWAEGRYAAHTVGYEEVDTLPEEARTRMFGEVKARLRFNSMLLDKLREDALRHPPEGKEMGVLNHEVTNAILIAEEVDHEAARAWEHVWRAEEAIARCSPPGVERSIALDGVKTAKAKAKARREHR
jgi:hypothetical protein